MLEEWKCVLTVATTDLGECFRLRERRPTSEIFAGDGLVGRDSIEPRN